MLANIALVVSLTVLAEGRFHQQPIYRDWQQVVVVPQEPKKFDNYVPTFQTVAPPAASKKPNLLELATQLKLTTFVEMLKKTHIDNTIDHEGPYTVFAASNAAFERIPPYTKKYDIRDIAKFHVARGDYYEKEFKNDMLIRSLLSKRDIRINVYEKDDGKTKIITANGQLLNQTDFEAHNGILHIIEGVMHSIYQRQGDAFTELQSLPVATYNTLERALSGTGLSNILSSAGPFTLLAPTDDAFKALPADLVSRLINNETAMAQVLKNHIVSGTVYSLGLENGKSLRSLIEEELPVTITQGSVTIGGASVILPDFSVSNGVIHGIDKVLIPNEMEVETRWKWKPEERLLLSKILRILSRD